MALTFKFKLLTDIEYDITLTLEANTNLKITSKPHSKSDRNLFLEALNEEGIIMRTLNVFLTDVKQADDTFSLKRLYGANLPVLGQDLEPIFELMRQVDITPHPRLN